MKRILSLLFFAGVLSCFSQNTVLWKVSGKGLTKPSYIYGTVHLTDKRVFNTNDSLRAYIAACDYFAAELHPDSLNALMFGMYTKEDTSDVYRSTFDSEDYDRIDRKLKNDFNINLKQIKSRDLRHLKMLLNPHKKRKDDYPTFLDGYLMGLARRQGKTIIGLEGVMSHEKAFTALHAEDAYKKDIVELSKENKDETTLEELVKIYLNGDLAGIEKNYTDFSYDALYNLLDRRNEIMAATIDSVVKEHTLFAAFGAAHLVGEKGIIKLLIKKGYTLTPIYSKNKSYLSTTGIPVSYANWQVTTLPNLGINYSLPGSSGKMKKELIYNDFKTYIDITSGITYFVFPVASAMHITDKQKIYAKYEEGFNSRVSSGTKKSETFTYKGMEGYRVEMESNATDVSCHLFIENNIFYILCVAYPKTLTDKQEIDYFFNSVSIYKPVAEEAYHYKNDKWAFEMDFPAKPLDKTSVDKRDGVRTEKLSLRASDNINAIHYLIETVDIGSGKYVPNDSVILGAVYNSIKDYEKTRSVKDTSYQMQGAKYSEVRAGFSDSSYMISYSMMRGFRVYSLTCVLSTVAERNHNHDAFLNSFHFLPLENNTFKDYPLPIDSALVVRSPQPWKEIGVDSTDEADEDGKRTFKAYDPQTAITYYVQRKDRGPYYYTKADSLMWKEEKEDLLGWDDTLLTETARVVNGVDTKTFAYAARSKTSTTKRMIMDMGDYTYVISAYTPRERVYEQQDAPFEYVSYKAPLTKKVVSDTAAFHRLVADYYSNDSVRYRKAMLAEINFTLTDNMLRDIREVLDRKETLNDTDTWVSMKSNLIRKLADLKDTTAVYKLIAEKLDSPKDSAYRHNYLALLGNMKNVRAYGMIRDYMATHPYDAYNLSTALYVARDTLQLAKMLLPEVLKSLKKMDSLDYAGVSLIDAMLADSTITYDAVAPYESDLIGVSKKFFNWKQKGDDLYSVDYNNIIADILQYSTNKGIAQQHFTDLSNAKNTWCRYYGNYYLLATGQQANKKTFSKLLEDPYLRYKAYEELGRIGKRDAIPDKFRGQEKLAEGAIYYTVREYDELTADKVRFLKKHETTDDAGKNCTYYLYTVHFEGAGGKEQSLYAAGPFYADPNDPGTGSATGYLGEYIKGVEDFLLEAYLKTER